MGGGLIQLVSYGIENLYLSGNPEITFFKIIYRRHTNFSTEPIPQFFKNTPDFNRRVTCTISKNGDLISDMYLYVTLPSIIKQNIGSNLRFAWTNKIGFSLIKNIELEIGGQLIDKQYGDWLNIWDELHKKGSNNIDGVNKMIGNIKHLNEVSNGKNQYSVYIPLNFWFCGENGLALPVIALQYNDIKIHVEFNKFEDCYIKSPSNYIDIDENIVLFKKGEVIFQEIDGSIYEGKFVDFDVLNNRIYYDSLSSNLISYTSSTDKSKYVINGSESLYKCYPKIDTSNILNSGSSQDYFMQYPSFINSYILVNYIYLDTFERKRFLKSNHEYLITQLQYSGETTLVNNNVSVKIPFSHPCKQIIWRLQMDFNKHRNDIFNYTTSYDYHKGKDIFKKGTILLNHNERVSERYSNYFNLIQPYQHHNTTPSKGISLYSFSLNPSGNQPSGTCNFSQIDEAKLQLHLDKMVSYKHPAKIRIYGLTHNIFRIVNGLGGLAYSN